jgi:hypothetical protein
MDERSNARGPRIPADSSVGVGERVGAGSSFFPSSTAADRRRFRVKKALRAVEDALHLLDPKPAEGIETDALRRVRDDLVIVLRVAEADCR